MKRLTFISLFAGIGGFDLGLERAGMKCIAQVECNDYCRKILARHWPRVPKYRDVRTFTCNSIRRRPDAIVGGFPCQDISSAGRKAGITGSRSGLWKEMLRIIRAFRPPFAIVENVSALRARGLDVVLSDLAAAGYDAEWDCIPAAAVGAPHRRDRIFIVAHAKRLRLGSTGSIFGSVPPGQSGAWASAEDGCTPPIVGRAHRRYPAHLRVDDGIPGGVDRVKACGNAVVPQVGEWIGNRLQEWRGRVVCD